MTSTTSDSGSSSNSKVPLRIGVVQFDPKIGDIPGNIAHVRQLCSKIQPKTLDLLCFPEMAFSGYVFSTPDEISPYLESPETGPTSVFCKDEAKRLGCCVIGGYPEILDPPKQHMKPQVGYNSAIMYSSCGEVVGKYRKTHLYETDMSWAVPGKGFATLHPPPPLPSPITLAICMDLNSQTNVWSAAGGPYEVAEHALQTKSKLVILLNNWLDSNQASAEEEQGKDEEEDWPTIQFWASRLRPLYCSPDAEGLYHFSPHSPAPKEDEVDDEIIVVVCNRCGVENGVTFAGSSSIFSMSRTVGRPRLLDVMGKREEGVRIWSILV